MSAMSDYLESGVINWLFRGQAFTPPSNVSIALTSGVPIDSDDGSTIPELPQTVTVSGEPVNTGYNRINYATPDSNGASKFNYNNGVGVSNSEQIVFPTALTDWGPVSGIAITDSPIPGSGKLLMYTELDRPRTVYNGEAPKFDTNKFQIEIS